MPVDRGLAVRAVAAVFLSLVCSAIILRCYVRIRIVKALGWDDGIMLIATAFYIMFSACMIGGSLWGTGQHFTSLTPKESMVAMKYWYLCDVGYALASILSKVSVCLLLLRVLIDPIQRAVICIATAVTAIIGFIFFVFCVVQCSPISYFWSRFLRDPAITGSCGHLTAIKILLYLFSAASASFDLIVAVVPIFVVRSLQMSGKTKVAVVCLLSIACIASIAVIVRIPFVNTVTDPDYLYATYEIAIWSNIETGLSIFAGSLATLRPLFSRFTGSGATNRPQYNSASGKLDQSRSTRQKAADRNSSQMPLTDLATTNRTDNNSREEVHQGPQTSTAASVHSSGEVSRDERWKDETDPNTSIRVFQSWDVLSQRNSKALLDRSFQ